MAYVPDEVLESFSFETGFHKKFKPAMDAYLAKKGKPTIEQRKMRATPKGEAPQVQNKLMAALNKAF